MNKLVIPAILGAVMLVGMSFAIMPVEKASAIHTSLGGAVQKATLNKVGNGAIVVPNSATNKFGQVCFSSTAFTHMILETTSPGNHGGLSVNATINANGISATEGQCGSFAANGVVTGASMTAGNVTATWQVAP